MSGDYIGTHDFTNATVLGVSGGGASGIPIVRTIEGEIFTSTLMYAIVPDEWNALDIKEVRVGVSGLPVGADITIDVRKNGIATTDSIFTSDAEIEIGTGQTATNGIYQTGCDISGATVGTPGTTIDSARDNLAENDVLHFVVTQVGSTFAGADLTIILTLG